MMVSIAICTRDREAPLVAALESLSRLDSAGLEWETLVVDNGSRRPVADVARPFAAALRLRTEVEPQPGLSHARNRCLRLAKGDYILFIDDDVTVPPGWLRAYVEAFERHPEAGAFGGPIRAVLTAERGRDRFEALRRVMPGALSEHQPGLGAGPVPADGSVLPWGANMAFRRAALEGREFDVRLGRRPGRAVLSGEETRLLRQVAGAGYAVVWAPEAMVRHHVKPDRLSRAYLRRFCLGLGWSMGYEKAHGVDASWRAEAAGLSREARARRRRLWLTPPWAPLEERWRALREWAVLEGLRRGFVETCEEYERGA